MGSGFLSAISTICSSVGLAVFLYWLIESVSRSYRSGVAVQAVREASADLVPVTFPLADMLNRIATAILPLADDWMRRDLLGLAELSRRWDRDLVRAGLRSRFTPQQFLAILMFSTCIPSLIFALFSLLVGLGVVGTLLVTLLLGTLPGFVIPSAMLRSEVKNRVSLIDKRLPFAIEFMLLALEARAAFRDAIEIYCRQMSADPLADELHLALSDMSAGLPVQDALENMSSRIQSDDVSAFVLAVTTGISTGQPMKDILETQATVARMRRFQAAEQVAKTASTRAIFPLFLVVIAILILLIGPLVIRISQHSLF
jgi:pilus assembly protein TadC